MSKLVEIFEAIIDKANDREDIKVTSQYVKAYAENGMNAYITDSQAKAIAEAVGKYDCLQLNNTNDYYHLCVKPLEEVNHE